MNISHQIPNTTAVLNKGGVAIFPTDTAFAIGCRVDREESVKRVFAIRRRPISQAVPVLIDSITMAQNYWLSPLPNIVRRLMEKYWPGGLTIIYKAQPSATPPLVRGFEKNIGLRMPNHKITRELIRSVGVALIGPSANFHGENTPYSLNDLNPKLTRLADIVVRGECQTKIASTVIDLTHPVPQIIRQGAVTVAREFFV